MFGKSKKVSAGTAKIEGAFSALVTVKKDLTDGCELCSKEQQVKQNEVDKLQIEIDELQSISNDAQESIGNINAILPKSLVEPANNI